MRETLQNGKRPCIYFVLPCYNEEPVLPQTSSILLSKVTFLIENKIISDSSRILFVDDGSRDSTWNIICDLHQSNPSLFGGVKLAHNRGHQNALLAGLTTAYKSGCDAAISMDADLQDDVDVVDQFIAKYVEGYEVVYGVRSSRETDTWFKRNTALAFYSVFKWMGAETVPNHADYRLMGKNALKALLEYKEVNLFLRGIVPSIGFKSTKVEYVRGKRKAGVSKYPLKKMISFAIDGITSFSAKPLSFVTFAGFASILVSLCVFVYVIVSVLQGKAVAGWGSVMFSMWFIGGLIMLSIGIVGEYIGKIYMESKHRPRYEIETTI